MRRSPMTPGQSSQPTLISRPSSDLVCTWRDSGSMRSLAYRLYSRSTSANFWNNLHHSQPLSPIVDLSCMGPKDIRTHTHTHRHSEIYKNWWVRKDLENIQVYNKIKIVSPINCWCYCFRRGKRWMLGMLYFQPSLTQTEKIVRLVRLYLLHIET